jgi:hypothetical protein
LSIQEEVGYGGDFVYDKAVGHEIKWKADKDLTKKVEIKKQRNKSAFLIPVAFVSHTKTLLADLHHV